MILGELAALATAVCFAAGTTCFALASRRGDAQSVNAFRLVVALAELALLHRVLEGHWWPAASGQQQLYLLASGIIGLTLGDLFLFQCLAHAGPRVGSVLMSFTPALTALLAWPLLGERIDAVGVVGMSVLTVGVIVAVAARPAPGGPQLYDRINPKAVIYGLLGALGQAVGFIFSKQGMEAHADQAAISPLSGTLLRMLAATLGMLVVTLALGKLGSSARVLLDRRILPLAVLGATTGTVLGIWLSLVAVKHTEAGIAAALIAVTPLVVIVIGRVVHGERPGRLAVAGTLAAVAGAAILLR